MLRESHTKYKIAHSKISAYDVENAISKIFNISWFKRFFGSRIYISDEYYMSVDIDELKKWLADDNEDKKEYVSVDHDCDDFSFELMGRLHEVDPRLAVGIVWVRAMNYGHALNFIIDKNKEFWFLEPQNDDIFNKKPIDWNLILAII